MVELKSQNQIFVIKVHLNAVRTCCIIYDSIAPVVIKNNSICAFWSEID